MLKKYLGTVLLPGNYDPLTKGHMNSLKYLSERSDRVIAVIMALKTEEHKRWIPSNIMKELIELSAAYENIDNVTAYVEDEGWIAHSIEKLGSDCVARSFHPAINVDKEMELISSIVDLDVNVHIVPSKLEISASNIRWLYTQGLLSEFKDQLPVPVYEYIQSNKR